MFPFNSTAQPQSWPSTPIYYPNNVNPYQQQTFLNEIFDFNQESIAAFQTLSHELKLQFFLSVQEMKLLGYMSDKNAYQNILQEIARRKLILQKPSTAPTTTKQRKESEEWGAKLENLCDDHLKKMQRDNFLDDIPVQYNPQPHVEVQQVDFLSGETKKDIQNDDDQFEWSDSKETVNEVNYSSEIYTGKLAESSQVTPSTAYKSFQQLFIKKQKKQEAPPQKVEHIDVWDLQVIQQQPKSNKKCLPELKKSESKKKVNIFTQMYELKQNQRSNNGQDITDFDLEYFNVKPVVNAGSNGTISNNVDNVDCKTTGSKQEDNVNSVITNSETLYPVHEERHVDGKEGEGLNVNIEINGKNDEEQFEWQQEQDVAHPLEQLVIQPVNSVTVIIPTQPLGTHSNAIFDPIEIIPALNPNNPEIKTDNQQFNYNFLSSIPIVQPVQSQQIIQQNGSTIFQTQILPSNPNNGNPAPENFAFDTSFGLDLTGLDNQFNFNNTYSGYEVTKNQASNNYSEDLHMFHKKNNAHEEVIDNRADEERENEMMESSTIMPTTIDFNILDQLKVFPSTSKLMSSLSKKIFDFDRHFYQEGLHLISVLGYQQNPDYDYIKEQSQICDQIFRLTELYTAAVDQDKEQQVMENLRKSKKLYLQLDTKKTATIIRKYMKMEGKSLSYQIGKLSLQAGVPKELIEKAIKSNKFNQTATLLYLMVFFGNTYSISLFACQVIEYVEHLCAEMEQLLQSMTQMEQQVLTRIRTDAKFLEYRDNICKIMTVARRVLELGSICVRDELSPNIAKVNQQISGMIPPVTNVQLLPNYFLTFFSNFACSNCNSIYTLHSQMQEFVDEHPLCSLCLQPIQEIDPSLNGAKKQDSKYYHFKCWNFRASVMEYKRQLMAKLELQFEASKSQEQVEA